MEMTQKLQNLDFLRFWKWQFFRFGGSKSSIMPGWSPTQMIVWILIFIYVFRFIHVLKKSSSENTRKVVNVTRNVETWILALWAPLIKEMEESASHHVSIVAFAQLRAEDNKNEAQNPWKWPESFKITISWSSENDNFLDSPGQNH